MHTKSQEEKSSENPTPRKVSRTPFSLKLEQFVATKLQHIENQLQEFRIACIRELQDIRQSQVIVYYSAESLVRRDAKRFYEVLTTLEDVKNLDLFLMSPGGLSDPAFKMARLCQELVGEGRFSVLIPSYAKSAATILALGADGPSLGTGAN